MSLAETWLRSVLKTSLKRCSLRTLCATSCSNPLHRSPIRRLFERAQ